MRGYYPRTRTVLIFLIIKTGYQNRFEKLKFFVTLELDRLHFFMKIFS